MNRAGRLLDRRIAVYQRYSSDNQRESSLEDQLHRTRQFVEREGGDPTKLIIVNDAAVSGSKFRRTGLSKLLDLAQAGAIDAVVVEDLSRLTRDTEHAAAMLKLFARCGVTLYGVADGIDTSQSHARLNVGLRAVINETYLSDLGDKTLRGQEGRARAGLSTGGRLFGYGSEPISDGFGGISGFRIVVCPDQARVVERIFDLYANGASLADIADDLNRAKIASPRANPKPGSNPKYFRRGWSASTVRDMLHNEAYIGKRAFKRRKWTRTNELSLGREGRTPRRRNPAEVIHYDGPRIISDDLWQAVQNRLRAVRAFYTKGEASAPHQRPTRPGGRTTHLLSGVMQCVCGASMVLVGGSSAKYYGCNDNKKRGPHVCANKLTVREDVTREAVLGELRASLLSPRGIGFLRECIARELAQHGRNSRQERDEREKSVARTRERIARLVDFVANGDTSDAVRTTLKDLEVQARSEEGALRDLEAAAQRPAKLPSPEEVLRQAIQLEETLMSDPTRGRELLIQLFEHGRLVLEPQPEGHYVARSRWFPLRALTTNTRRPQSGGPGPLEVRATPLGCAGRI